MTDEIVRSIVTVLVTSILASGPAWWLIAANKKRIEAEVEEKTASLTNVLNETALDWVNKMREEYEALNEKFLEQQQSISEYQEKIVLLQKQVSELYGKIDELKVENLRLLTRIRAQDKIIAESEALIEQLRGQKNR